MQFVSSLGLTLRPKLMVYLTEEGYIKKHFLRFSAGKLAVLKLCCGFRERVTVF